MLSIPKMIASAEECLGWPYDTPGTNDSRGIDCSGLFVKIYKDQGAKIYHGSNTIYRDYCTSDKGPIIQVSQLAVGMAVFKWNPNTPPKFNDGLGDFQHIGLVISTNPLKIIHASSASGCVTIDTKIGKWKYYGRLKDVDYGNHSVPANNYIQPSEPSAISVTYPTVRKGDRGDVVKTMQEYLAKAGSSLTVDGIFGNGTENAVKAFQRKQGLEVDGVVGPKTWTKLLEVSGNIQIEEPADSPAYVTVTISQLTERQADELMKQYPNSYKTYG